MNFFNLSSPLIIAAVVCLSGCQTSAQREKARGDDAVRMFANFVEFKGHLPASQAELVTFAGTYGDRVAVRSLQQVTFKALDPASVRMNFRTARGAPDYRSVIISGPAPLRLTSGPRRIPYNVFSDQKLTFAMYIGRVPGTSAPPRKPNKLRSDSEFFQTHAQGYR